MRRNDSDYDELKAKYEILLKKEQGRVIVDEGKCWDDSDEDEEYNNLALMIHLGDETSSSFHLVPIFTIVDMNTFQYKKIVDNLRFDIFNIHTSMTAANEEIIELTSTNKKLKFKNDELKNYYLIVTLIFKFVSLECVKQDNDYLKKIICAL